MHLFIITIATHHLAMGTLEILVVNTVNLSPILTNNHIMHDHPLPGIFFQFQSQSPSHQLSWTHPDISTFSPLPSHSKHTDPDH